MIAQALKRWSVDKNMKSKIENSCRISKYSPACRWSPQIAPKKVRFVHSSPRKVGEYWIYSWHLKKLAWHANINALQLVNIWEQYLLLKLFSRTTFFLMRGRGPDQIWTETEQTSFRLKDVAEFAYSWKRWLNLQILVAKSRMRLKLQICVAK